MQVRPKGRTKTGKPTKTGTKHAAMKFTRELGQSICELTALGQTQQQIADRLGVFKRDCITNWALRGADYRCDDPLLQEFSRNYRRAREIWLLGVADDLRQIAGNRANDTINGRPNNAAVQRDKLEVETLKWIASRMLPKVYGDQQTITHEGNPDAPIEVNHRDLARTMIEVLGTQALEKVEKS